jgi:hypothetical protein
MGKLTSRHRAVFQDIQRTMKQNLTFKNCLLNSYAATEARNIYTTFVSVEKGCLKEATREEHEKCYASFMNKLTRCKTKGIFEAIGRCFAFFLTIPIDTLRAICSFSTKDCCKYTKANAKAISDSFTKPNEYANMCQEIDKTRRHSPSRKKNPRINLKLNLGIQ